MTFDDGFFPFNVAQDDVPASTDQQWNAILPLHSLTKAYWLAKSFDYNINIAWTATIPNPPFAQLDWSGTAIGSGTIALPNIEPARRVGPVSTPLGFYPMWMPTGGDPNIGLRFPVPLAWTFLVNGTLFNSGTVQPSLWWFIDSAAVSHRAANYNSVTRKYSSKLNLSVPLFSAGGHGVDYGTTPFNPVLIPNDLTVALTVDGVAAATIPLYGGGVNYGGSIRSTGTVALNFNNFWT